MRRKGRRLPTHLPDPSASDGQPPDFAALIDVITPFAVRVAATLRLADHIHQGCGQVDELAARAGAHPGALARLLRYLACRGVFRETAPGTFALTPTARLLRTGPAARLQAWLDLDGAGRMDLAFAGLLDAVRTGQPSYAGVAGRPFWEDLAASPARAAAFDAAMEAHVAWFAADIVRCFDWHGVRHVVDVGGGAGRLLTELLRAHPGLRGTLVDVPATTEAAARAIAAHGLSGRCQVVPGSFFDPLPGGGDVYLLRNVLHDWDDDRAAAILRRCAEAARPGGRVLIAETAEESRSQSTALDLRMLVLLGGRERTRAELAGLAAAAGMDVRSAQPTPAGLSLVVCGTAAAGGGPGGQAA